MDQKMVFNKDKKFDIQLSQSFINERRLGEVFKSAKLERVELSQEHWKIELKSETWQWERTGNICIEYRHNGNKSGIAATEADFWVHELKREDSTLVYIMIPVAHLKKLCSKYYGMGRYRENAGDDGRSNVILIPIREILS